jgi:hypothetical protein
MVPEERAATAGAVLGKPRIFLSSPTQHLEACRAAVYERLSGPFYVHAWEKDAPEPTLLRPLERKIRGSELFVLLLGTEYGSTIDGKDLSYTEWEFRQALKRRLGILAFAEDHTGNGANANPKQQQFIQHVKTKLAKHEAARHGDAPEPGDSANLTPFDHTKPDATAQEVFTRVAAWLGIEVISLKTHIAAVASFGSREPLLRWAPFFIFLTVTFLVALKRFTGPEGMLTLVLVFGLAAIAMVAMRWPLTGDNDERE